MEKTFRYAGYLEGISFLVLLGIAMPLKYLAGIPMAVRIVGSLHGIFFIAYLITGFAYGDKRGWQAKIYVLALVAAVIPFGPFLFEKRLLAAGR